MCAGCALLSIFQDSFLLLSGLILQVEAIGGENQQRNILTFNIWHLFLSQEAQHIIKTYYSYYLLNYSSVLLCCILLI